MSDSSSHMPLSPRKAPRQRRSVATVDAIVEAAARILERDGFDGYTTNAVAALAGVSIGSLYQYFPNRDALTAALVERESAHLLDDVDRAAALSSCDDVLRMLVRGAVTHQMRRPVLARLIDFEEARLPLGARTERVADRIHATLLHALGARDAPRVAAPDVVAHDLLAIVKGIVDAAGARGETDANALEARAWRAVRGYLRESREPKLA
ncbi:Transcriptional regulator, TetR family [Burkholderia cenocepacia]|jgi:AcrR family transcriptional regulator|uniref:TetR/AcrR family transcriptional regulator n=1 Tax=Burkholderia cenocepacia TaxID=95486 RepID=UPI00192C6698|nr:TetR/AcrR family transcriptional regulator [Burkholderia cenocepacia]MBR8153215.1 TetR/AcrR family transcriptional regulator [Burkholderia cenocepacia]MCA8082878.1 TetR/AcrR family transcriptional regulator [Burkholderia cenocepacia]CAD9217278.1 Transcriptional regulator, TetR family [Burkholderia cenocepacia]